ncbi:MAG: ABC transporter ATP-binding protein [Chloroflexi bacterium]|nr:ABC transporter ATP-binding protein [Chloroflexota bacterium]
MNPIRQIARFLRPYRREAIIAPLLMVVEVAIDLILPSLMERIIDVGIGTRNLPVVLNTGLLMLGLTFVGAFGGIGCTVFAVRAAMNYGADLRSAVYRKIQTLSFGNLDRLGTGQLVTRLTNDVNQAQEVVLIALRILVRAPLLVVGSLIMAILTSLRLAPTLVILVPFLTVVLVVVIRRSTPLFLRVQESLDRLNTTLQENLAGVRVVKAFVRGQHEEARFGAANDALMANSIRAMQFSAIVGPFMMLALNFGVAGALWFGGVQVTQGTMTVGEIVAFTNYLRQTLFSLQMVSMLLIQVSRAGASATRLAEVLNAAPDVQDRPGAQAAFPAGGRVAFEHVTFAYDGGDPVLQDISFVAEPGQTVAILGATGSGKSSLVSLIPRFYDVKAGRVTIGGVDVRDIPQAELRSHIGVALQDTILFSGSIAENIRQGRPAADDVALAAAAQAAQADDFITALPEGYGGELGQRGVNLSGGQKQRIAIARALIRQPDILILDDSTSAVDVQTEARLQAALDRLMAGRTSFVVAQRISTVLQADKILVLDEGRIAAEGTHQELIVTSPIYREIFESQLGNGALAAAGGVS